MELMDKKEENVEEVKEAPPIPKEEDLLNDVRLLTPVLLRQIEHQKNPISTEIKTWMELRVNEETEKLIASESYTDSNVSKTIITTLRAVLDVPFRNVLLYNNAITLLDTNYPDEDRKFDTIKWHPTTHQIVFTPVATVESTGKAVAEPDAEPDAKTK